MLEILEQYGLDRSDLDPFSDDPMGLIKLRKVYEANVEAMKGSNTLSKEEVAQLKDKAKQNESASELAKTTLSNIREVAYDCFDQEQDSLILLLEGLDEFVSILRFEVKDWINNVGKSAEQREANKASLVERYEAAEQLQKFILSLFQLQKSNLNLTDPVFGEEGFFPVKDSKLNGVVPTLSRLPHDPRKKSEGTDGRKGRPVHSKSLRFNWNGEDLPVGTMGTQVAKEFVSDGKAGVRVAWKDIKEAVEKIPANLSKDEWELTFETGTLKGWVDESVVVSKGKK